MLRVGSLLFGATATQAATVEDICGQHNVINFSGMEEYYFSSNKNFTDFVKSDYKVDISVIENNKIKLSGLLLWGETLVGEFNPESNEIIFPAQITEAGDYEYIFCKEEWNENEIIVNMESEVVATVDAEGKIKFNGWTLVSPYDDGTYWTYFKDIKCELSTAFKIKQTYEATWNYFESNNENCEVPDLSETRTLNLYDDNSYQILNAFGSDNSADVLTFVLTEDNVTFLNMQIFGGSKYIYYNDPDYSYIYDSSYQNGAWSSYAVEDNKNIVWFWISGSYGYGWINLIWPADADSISNIAVDTNGPVQYFNLQGMSVNQDNLRPGIYIVRQGNQARKVLVK